MSSLDRFDDQPGIEPVIEQRDQNLESTPKNSAPSYIVGIGASAGGLEALEQFFERMPPDSGMAFVVVQHLSPDFRSLMDELLAHRTEMPIHRVTDGIQIAANAIYLIPPKKDMIAADGRLLLTDKEPSQPLTLPIDHFFRSLAHDAGRRAIGIVLSGTGSDGSRGIRDIHEAGGLVLAQSVESAKFDGMPKSACDTGVVDLVLPPTEMPEALLRFANSSFAGLASTALTTAPAEKGMGQLFQLLRTQYGIDFSHYKPATVTRRIERRLQLSNSPDLDAYVADLVHDPEELNLLYKDLLIGVTKFFRDPDAFERLAIDVIPGLLLNSRREDEGIRIWVAGCATGEEAYSLAILLHEQISTLERPVSVKIFATDVHLASIDYASAGVYPEESLSEVSHARRETYFIQNGDGYQVIPELRQMIVFAHHNIIKDAPFTRLDLITCRNLLIYLQPPAQKKVISLFHFGMKTGGTLFLGPSESPGDLADEFETVDLHWKIYRKKRDIRLPADLRLPTSPAVPRVSTADSNWHLPRRAGNQSTAAIYESLLQEFMPASLLINDRNELVHTFGGAEQFLKLRGGRTSTSALDLVDKQLRVPIASMLNRLTRHQEPIRFSGVCIDTPHGQRRVTLSAKQYRHQPTATVYSLITFESEDETPGRAGVHASAAPQLDVDEATRDQFEALEIELRYTKENLQATVEELETSNEELQASNEELVASNEELQSTNEELHSVNEELYTVNAEYQRKILELTQLNNDMDNLLRSTEIGTIFLDNKLCIRKFTPQIAHTFNLLPQDVGRRIDTFVHNIDETHLPERVLEVLASGRPYEREVLDRHGHWFWLRILPYQSPTSGVEGAVLTLTDIDPQKKTQTELHELNRQLQGILDNSTTLISVKDLDGRYRLCNPTNAALLHASQESILGKTNYDFLPKDVADVLAAHDREVVSSGRVCEFEETIPHAGAEHIYLSVKFPLHGADGRIDAVGAVCTDITARKRAELEKHLAVVRRDQFLAMLSHELRNPLSAIVTAIRILESETDDESKMATRRIIGRQAEHMSRLLDDLLDVSRVTQGKIEMKREVVDLRESTSDAIDAVQPRIVARHQRLTVDLPKEPLFVEGDPVRLQQIQANLLTNASKYNSDGGSISLSIEREGDEALIRVKDDGVGIPHELQDKIFDLFVQSNATLDRADGGMGVGLTLVRAVVEKHNGQITVQSDGPGLGSEFIVRLPLTAKRPLPRLPEAPASRAELLKVLIVEDNTDSRETLRMLLELEGYSVVTAADGKTGIRAIESEKPDVALVDIGLPQVDGYELARRVRSSNGAARDVYLIALTGYGQSSDRERALAAGFDMHMVKPVDTAELARLLARHSAGKGAESEL